MQETKKHIRVMEKKKYKFVCEKIYRTSFEIELDMDELRKHYPNLSDEDILFNVGLDDIDNSNHCWQEDENNIRTIYENGTLIYED